MVAPALIGAGIGAATGALKYSEDKKAADRKRKEVAEVIRTSPWTGMTADPTQLQDPSLMGNMIQGGLTGASFGMQDYFNPEMEDVVDDTTVADLSEAQKSQLMQQTPGQMMRPSPGDVAPLRINNPWMVMNA